MVYVIAVLGGAEQEFLVPNAPLQEADSRAIRSLDLVSLLKDSLWAPEFDTVVT